MVRLLQVMLRFYHHESCGQCTPCREGMGWLHRIIDRIVAGEGRPEDIERLYADLAPGTTAPRSAAWATPPATPRVGILAKFRDEFEYFIEHKRSRFDGNLECRRNLHRRPADSGRARPDRDAGGARARLRHPVFLLAPGAVGRRQLPHLRRPGRRPQLGRDRLQHAGQPRACACSPTPTRCGRTARRCCSSSRSTIRSTAASATRPASARCRTTTTSTTARRRCRATPRCASTKFHPLSERIVLDNERCILCSRCVRFTREISKSNALGIQQRGDHSLVRAAEDGALRRATRTPTTSSTSARSARCCRGRSCYKARVWYLQADAVGLPGLRARLHASTSGIASRSGSSTRSTRAQNARIERVTPLENPAVNGPWICNKGRDLAQIFERPRATQAMHQGHAGRARRGDRRARGALIDARAAPGRAGVELGLQRGARRVQAGARRTLRRVRQARLVAAAGRAARGRSAHPRRQESRTPRRRARCSRRWTTARHASPTDTDLVLVWGEGFDFARLPARRERHLPRRLRCSRRTRTPTCSSRSASRPSAAATTRTSRAW